MTMHAEVPDFTAADLAILDTVWDTIGALSPPETS